MVKRRSWGLLAAVLLLEVPRPSQLSAFTAFHLPNLGGPSVAWRGRRSVEARELGEETALVEDSDIALSHHARRFRAILESLTCTEEELAFVQGSRLRHMLRGVAAIAKAKPAARAFEILYEDLAPVRFACDVLVWRLEGPVAEAAHSLTSLPFERSAADLAAARELFELIDRDGSGTLDRDELLATSLLRSLGHCEGCTCEGEMNCRSVDNVMQEVDADGDGSISFLEFMLSASRVLFGGRSVAEAGPEAIELLQERSPEKPKADLERRFEDILETIRSWEGSDASRKALEADSRKAEILEGLLVGAKVPELASALKVMYVDYLPLRIGGDLIFRIARKFMMDNGVSSTR